MIVHAPLLMQFPRFEMTHAYLILLRTILLNVIILTVDNLLSLFLVVMAWFILRWRVAANVVGEQSRRE
jgi:hypothetical protein